MIVCTRNRATRLPTFLAALSRLDGVPFDWELLIVDHASTDDTGRLLQEFSLSAPFPVRALRADATTLSGAKNQAIAIARGEILAFTDDDCYPRPDYLRALAQVFDSHPVGVVGGRVVLHDLTDAKLSILDSDTPLTIPPRTFVRAGVMHGANLALKREVVAAVGGFDPLLGPGSPCVAAEDVELIARAVWAGWSARYDPAPVVSHHHGRKPGEETERVRRAYDYGRGAYYAKFLLNRQSRDVYLRQWYHLMRRGSGPRRRRRVAHELAGGGRYIVQRLLRGPSIPRAEAAAC